jgi:hypothetical protein
MGPGTHVLKRVLNGVQPTTHTDAVALTHDINYLIAGNDPSKAALADQLAIDRAGYSFQGSVMKVGLTLRYKLALPFYKSAVPSSVGEGLKYVVLNSQKFKAAREDYHIDSSWFL